jgi:hypothetical protein
MDPAVSTQSDTAKLIIEPLKLEWISEEPFFQSNAFQAGCRGELSISSPSSDVVSFLKSGLGCCGSIKSKTLHGRHASRFMEIAYKKRRQVTLSPIVGSITVA